MLGIPLLRNEGGSAQWDNSPSLDRLVPGLGYVPGNVIVVSSRANVIRNNASIDELRKVLQFYESIL